MKNTSAENHRQLNKGAGKATDNEELDADGKAEQTGDRIMDPFRS